MPNRVKNFYQKVNGYRKNNIYEYRYLNRKLDKTSKILIESLIYDKEGNILFIDDFKRNAKTIFLYNSNNKLFEQIEISPTICIKLKYNDKGYKTSSELYEDGKIYYRTKHNNGYEISDECYKKGKIKWKLIYKYIYNKKRKLESIETYEKNKLTTIAKYNSRGEIISRENLSGKFRGKDIYEYDNERNLISIIDENGKTLFKYKYDNKRNLISTIDEKGDYLFKYEYDDNKNLISEIRENKKFIYKYNEKNLLIKEIKYENDEPKLLKVYKYLK